MPNPSIKHVGVWTESTPFQKDQGKWYATRAIYQKINGVWISIYDRPSDTVMPPEVSAVTTPEYRIKANIKVPNTTGNKKLVVFIAQRYITMPEVLDVTDGYQGVYRVVDNPTINGTYEFLSSTQYSQGVMAGTWYVCAWIQNEAGMWSTVSACKITPLSDRQLVVTNVGTLGIKPTPYIKTTNSGITSWTVASDYEDPANEIIYAFDDQVYNYFQDNPTVTPVKMTLTVPTTSHTTNVTGTANAAIIANNHQGYTIDGPGFANLVYPLKPPYASTSQLPGTAVFSNTVVLNKVKTGVVRGIVALAIQNTNFSVYPTAALIAIELQKEIEVETFKQAVSVPV